MYQSAEYCEPVETRKPVTLLYDEYYIGDKDENRRNGDGQNFWTGAESIDWHTGRFILDSMHGPGDYRWRFLGQEGLFLTYEGHFYINQFHGYGAVSYPDGRVFSGLFKNDVRYGPGVDTFLPGRANVGFWCGGRLARLAWQPATPKLIPELPGTVVQPYRVVLNATVKTIGKVNSAVEFLKQHGSDPVMATKNWSRLYPKHCTDRASQLCPVDLFDHRYYDGGKIYSLKKQGCELHNDEELQNEIDETHPIGPYYAWNNNNDCVDMMNHCFRHEWQRPSADVNLLTMLSGPRSSYKPPYIHELDCRTLLMACYLGHIASTTFLVNERKVDPNIADVQGNTAVMYATCGDQPSLIHFLVEAGAEVNSANDSCCTALTVALIRFLCVKHDIHISGTLQALVPPPQPVVPTIPVEPQQKVLEWLINREAQAVDVTNQAAGKTSSKLNKMNRSLTSVRDRQPNARKTTDIKTIKENNALDSNEFMDNEDKLYNDINSEYITKVTSLFESVPLPVTYLFDFRNMVDEINEEQQKQKMLDTDKNLKKKSTVLKEAMKPSIAEAHNTQKDVVATSLDSSEKLRSETCDRIELTILQLLESGADPNLVKCPQPALVMAIVADSPALVHYLILHGVDVNEVYPQFYHYTPLHVALAQPMNQNTLEMVRLLLSSGGRADRQLRVHTAASDEPEVVLPGPTLLHAMCARKCECENEEDVRKQIIHLLLQYNCDPLSKYNGSSSLEEATKDFALLDIIIKNPKTNLNAAINDSNQTILVKMFHMPFFNMIDNTQRSQMLRNLLLFGASPLIECEHEGIKYKNLFVIVRKTLSDINSRIVPTSPSKTKIAGGKKGTDSKVADQGKAKKEPKKEDALLGVIANLQQAIDLMADCSRMIYIRWLQTQLFKVLIKIVDRYKHRHWSMIIKEHARKKTTGLWLTAKRCLEIWTHLETTKRMVYKDKNILRHLLCITHFYQQRVMANNFDSVTYKEKNDIELYVSSVLRDEKRGEIKPLQQYVQPELFVNANSNFNVCFECFLPLTEDQFLCPSCEYVSFCNTNCLRESVNKSNGHACNDYLIIYNLASPSSTIGDNMEPKTPQHTT